VKLRALPWSYTVRNEQPVRSFVYMANGGEGHEGMELMQTKGTVKSLDAKVPLHPRLPPFHPLIAHASRLAASASGSPLLNADGGVIGVNTLTGRDYGPVSPVGYSYAQPATTIRDLLAELSPGEDSPFSGWSDEHRCHRAMNSIAGLPSDMSMRHSLGGGKGGEEHMHDDDHDKGGDSMSGEDPAGM
jgi:hypothetical protein